MKHSWNRTYTFIKRLGDIVTFGKIAQLAGKEMQTAEAWAREPESLENPHGSGRRNPLDTVLRLIAEAHKHDAGLAREMALTFIEYVDFLDGKKGIEELKRAGSICELVGRSAKEHTDVVVEMLKNPNPNFHTLKIEHLQAMSALIQVGACIDEELKKDIQADLDKQNHGLKKVA
jgi:hypothetical protein